MTQNEEVGKAIVDLLLLTEGKDRRFKTAWGTKTREGLGASILRTLEEVAGLYIE